MAPDYQAAWELYYILAERRHKAGLVFDEVKQIVDAALGIESEDDG